MNFKGISGEIEIRSASKPSKNVEELFKAYNIKVATAQEPAPEEEEEEEEEEDVSESEEPDITVPIIEMQCEDSDEQNIPSNNVYSKSQANNKPDKTSNSVVNGDDVGNLTNAETTLSISKAKVTEIKKRKSLCLSEKKNLLVAYDALPKMSMSEAAEKLKVPRTTLITILKKREEIEGSHTEGTRKRKRSGKDAAVETALVKWMGAARQKKAPLSGPLVMEKAEDLAKMMGREDFKATTGWLQRLKKREGLKNEKTQRGKDDAEDDSGSHFLKEIWPRLRARFKEEDIFAADESSLYFRALPRLVSKERITVLFCASATGEKKKLLVVGRQRNPRCFLQAKSLPVRYCFSSNARMTCPLFTNWLKDWDDSLRGQNRRILLLVNNDGVHRAELKTSNIEIFFLPPEASSILQPCHRGIIRTCKAIFRRDVCRLLLERTDAEESSATPERLAQRMSLLDAVNLLSGAWEEVEGTTLRNSWRRSGLKTPEEEEPEEPPSLEGVPTERDKFLEWVDSADEDPLQSLTDKAIVEEVMNLKEAKEDEEMDEEGEEEEEAIVPSPSEMRHALEVLQKGLQAKEGYDFLQFIRFRRSLEKLLPTTLKQETIDKFFVQ